jgi:PadR family transcriptional regulator PadR
MNGRFFDNWTNQLRKGMLELCILNDIRNRRMYGYEIVRKLRKIEGLIISEGTIYPILSRLKRQGLVETSIQESPEGPPRKYYQLTEQGKEMVCQMNAYWQAISNQTHSIEKRKRNERINTKRTKASR